MNKQIIAIGFMAVLAAFATVAQDFDLDLLDEADDEFGEIAEELGAGRKGGWRFRLVDAAHPDESIEPRLYWRTIPGSVAAQTFFDSFSIGGQTVIGPEKVVLENNRGTADVRRPEGFASPPQGHFLLKPGDIPFDNDGGRVSSTHPAVRIGDMQVDIMCAPVRFRTVASDGSPAVAPVQVGSQLLRSDGPFASLAVWVPIETRYESTFGAFSVAADGTVTALAPADRVELVDNVLVRTLPPPRETTLDFGGDAEPAKASGPVIWPQRSRAVFAQTETAVFNILFPRGTTASRATITLDKSDAPARPNGASTASRATITLDGSNRLGGIDVPAVDARDWDSRAFSVDMSAIAPGKHTLGVDFQNGGNAQFAFEVVRWTRRNPFLVQTMSCCTGLWPQDDDGLAALSSAGLEMLAATGHYSMFSAADALPKYAPADGASEPVEILAKRPESDLLLERALRNRLRIADLTVARGANMYNEGLSFHHSAPVSVERMLRRMSVFATQSADFPSFFGVNYGWFPKLGGYVEGGVATDAHVQDRNAALARILADEGHSPPSAEEIKWYEENKVSADPGDRKRALDILRRRVDSWRAAQSHGFGDSLALYDAAVRKVRPDLACLMFDNAGHDGDNRARSEFNDLDAVCYESYTDYGEWPMSAAFSVDWARGTAPGKPVWLTADWGTTSEGMAKSLFHAFFRGLQGGGCPMQESLSPEEFSKRSNVLCALGQIGPIARFAIPEKRFALFADVGQHACDGRLNFDLHSLYVPLTRLGFPPIVVDGEDVAENGVPRDVHALFIARQHEPFLPETEAALDEFVKRRGRIYVTSDCEFRPKGATDLGFAATNIWSFSGFQRGVHADLWKDFDERIREPLAKRLAHDGFAPRVGVDPSRGFGLTLDMVNLSMTPGPNSSVRYVLVASDADGSVYGETRPAKALSVVLDGEWKYIRDITRQANVAGTVENGHTTVSLDLVSEPIAVLALMAAPPESIAIERIVDVDRVIEDFRANDSDEDVDDLEQSRPADIKRLGEACRASVTDTAGNDLGQIPLSVEVVDADGNVVDMLARAAGDKIEVPLPSVGYNGGWKLRAKELITGRTAECPLEPAPPAGPSRVARATGDVHIPNPEGLRRFVRESGEIAVIVEPSQRALMSAANEIAGAIESIGGKARVWEVEPDDFDTMPMRWRLREEDEARLEMVEAGELIGYRQDMESFIDPRTRLHDVDRGGYAEIAPKWRLGCDAIVFSGGVLADSLRGVSQWMPTPNTPGSGQARIFTCCGAFQGGRDVAVVAANDAEGFAKATKDFSLFISSCARKFDRVFIPSPGEPDFWQKVDGTVQGEAEVPAPLKGIKPYERVKGLMARGDGGAALWLDGENDTVVTIGSDGGVVASFRPDADRISCDAAGRVWAMRADGGNGAELCAISKNGAPLLRVRGDFGDRGGGSTPKDCEPLAACRVSQDGGCAFFGRFGAVAFGDIASTGTGVVSWRIVDDVPCIRERYEAWAPRFPVGSTFSPNGRFALCTMVDVPTGCTSMSGPDFDPAGNETMLFDAVDGSRVWSLRLPTDPSKAQDEIGRGACSRRSSKAGLVHAGFAAVADDGSLAAIADYVGNIMLIDGNGAIVMRHEARPTAVRDRQSYTCGAPGGVGVWMDSAGELAAFAFADRLWLATRDGAPREIEVGPISSGCVAVSGAGFVRSFAVVGLAGGEVAAFGADGTEAWRFACGGISPKVCASGYGRVLVATHSGTVIALDAMTGEEQWRVDAAAVADAALHEVRDAGDEVAASVVGPVVRDPGTLETAKWRLGARKIAEWEAVGEASATVYGRAFHAVESPVELDAEADGGRPTFAHVVYRLGKNGAPLLATVRGGGFAERFTLDLPTPEYRIVDLPIHPGEARVRLECMGGFGGDGGFELAELSLWSFEWPGENIAFVDSEGGGAGGLGVDEGGLEGFDDDLLGDLGGAGDFAGAMKECRVYIWNTDPDKVQGQYLKGGENPYVAVDGYRFRYPHLGGSVGEWSGAKDILGPWFTVDFPGGAELKIVATYDHELVQSRLSRQIAVFEGFDPEDRDSGKVLGAAVDNDQFWRLFPLGGARVERLGVHVRGTSSHGLSEIEAFISTTH